MGKVITSILKFSTVVLLCLFSFSLFAQKIYFCKGYSESGEPKGVSEKWNFENKGTEVVFLYNNGKTTFDFASLFFLVENKSTGTSDKVEFKVAQNRNWDALKYTFKEAGLYSVSALGNEGKLLAKADLKVGELKVKEEEKIEVKKVEPVVVEKVEKKKIEKEEVVQVEVKAEIPEKEKEKYDSKEVNAVLYYDDIKVVFCEQIKGGELINPSGNFKMGALGAYVEIVLQNTKALNTGTINVDIWKKEGSAFSEYVDDMQIKLNNKSKQMNFHRSFFKPGEYKISFFNQENVWMTTGYVTISQ